MIVGGEGESRRFGLVQTALFKAELACRLGLVKQSARTFCRGRAVGFRCRGPLTKQINPTPRAGREVEGMLVVKLGAIRVVIAGEVALKSERWFNLQIDFNWQVLPGARYLRALGGFSTVNHWSLAA